MFRVIVYLKTRQTNLMFLISSLFSFFLFIFCIFLVFFGREEENMEMWRRGGHY